MLNLIERTEENEIQNKSEINTNYRGRFEVNTVKSMWKLKEEYKLYHIFVWLENQIDMDMFIKLSFSGIMVEGFCNNYTETMGSFFGKPIVHIASIIYREDVLLVCFEDRKKEKLREKFSEKKDLLLSYDELFEICDQIKYGKVVVLYDSVKEAQRVVKKLQEYNANLVGTCALGNGNDTQILSEKSFALEEVLARENQYNIVLASSKGYYEKSILDLPNMNIDIFVPSEDIFYSSFLVITIGYLGLYLNKALRKGKKIILYGTESYFTNAWMNFLHTLGVNLDKLVDNCENMQNMVYSVYELAYENPKDTYIIINKEVNKWSEACELIESLGFSDFNEMYTGLYAVSYRHLPYITDISLGYVTSELLKNTECEGFRIYGEVGEEKYKIVTLGGSTTTSEAFRVPCWPELLFKKLIEEGHEIVIYNGGVDGYTAADELHKLIRDVSCIKPDLVISFSGINNRRRSVYPYVSSHLINVFEEICHDGLCKGLKNEVMSTAQIWIQQEQMMREISENVYNAKFICFVQPVYISKEKLLPWERLQFVNVDGNREFSLKFRKEVSELAKQFAWMVDMQDFFDEYPDVFFDSMHVYEKGNQMIADEIYNYIKEGL
ncbi:MAG: SGNH/GDSL hydrolase family protein [Lachnospiraceae bacterium]|nr:SGNH/GDSL hydrolase family protein [Lachnospiraceae bacterium]